MGKFRYRLLAAAVVLLFLAGMLYVGKKAENAAMGSGMAGEKKLCVVIDAGQGGGFLRQNACK